jgi:hypothetical protein
MENEEPEKESRCSPLTSIDLFDGAVDGNAERPDENLGESEESFFTILERCNTTQKYMDFVRRGILPDSD